MTVTKQQQLEWLEKNYESWPYGWPVMIMSDKAIGAYYGSPMHDCHFVSFTEWQQERGKMQKQVDQQAQDSSWHERGELPPVGCVCLYVISERCSYKVEITAHAKFGICFVEVGKSGESYVSKTAEHRRFQPLRTERENAIDEMVSGYQSAKCDKPVHPRVRAFAEYLYDAGCRKVKP